MEKKYFIYKYKHEKYEGKVYELLNSFFDFYQSDDEEKTLIIAGVDQEGKPDYFKSSNVEFWSKDELDELEEDNNK